MSRHYTLVASLPHLVHFERAERLPINRNRLDSRLTMLDAVQAGDLSRAQALVVWQRLARSSSSGQVATQYRDAMTAMANESLREFVAYRMDQRTVLAALRLRHRGAEAPPRAQAIGVGVNRNLILAHWADGDFGIGGVHPWIPAARSCIEQTRAVELERLLMDVVWQRLTRIGDASPFGFEGLFSYVFKWDITSRWLSHEPEAASVRFKELVTEAISEQQHLFG